MSGIARISGGVKKATLRNLPSIMFFNEQSRVSSSTHLLGGVGLPTTNSNSNCHWVKKKSNIWNLASSFFFNPNPNPNPDPVSIINHRTLSLLPFTTTSSKPFTTTTTTSKDKDKEEGGTSSKGKKDDKAMFQYAHKEKLKILMVLFDYDEPHNHLLDGVKVLSMVLQEWKKRRPNYELDYNKVDDLLNLNTSRISLYMVVDEKEKEATGNKMRTILNLLSDYDDPKFADQVLFQAMHCWKILISDINAACINLSSPIKDKHHEEVKYPVPSNVVAKIRLYKKLSNSEPLVEQIDAQIRKVVMKKKNGQSRVSSSTHLLCGVGLPTTNSNSNSNSNSNWVKKKSSFWNLASSSFFFNPNGITKQLPLLLPSLWPFTTKGKGKGKEEEDDTVENARFEAVEKEKAKILKVLLDYDEPENHLLDGVEVLSKVLKIWEEFRPKYELDYRVIDLVNPRFLSLVIPLLNVDEEAARKKIRTSERMIIKLLLDYDDIEFADQVLFVAIKVWKRFIWEVETDCVEVWTTNKDEHDQELNYPFPPDVITGVRGFKSLMHDYYDPNFVVKKVFSLI